MATKDNLVGMTELARAFGVTIMTLYTWRTTGTATRPPLPFKEVQKGERTFAMFSRPRVEQFAKKHGLELNFNRKAPPAAKPGPKSVKAPTKASAKPAAKMAAKKATKASPRKSKVKH